MKFEWDEAKSLANQRKHGVSFRDACTLLQGDDFLEIFDEEHSDVEDRFIAIGAAVPGVITVVWTERHEDVIRIISARHATSREAAAFHHYMESR